MSDQRAKDERKTKAELIDELEVLRAQCLRPVDVDALCDIAASLDATARDVEGTNIVQYGLKVCVHDRWKSDLRRDVNRLKERLA